MNDEIPAETPPRTPPSAWFWVFAAVCLAVLWFTLKQWQSAGSGDAALIPAGQRPPLPDLAFAALDDGEPRIAAGDLAGKVVFINYWGPWCGYCLEEFPDLVKLSEKYRSHTDFRFVSVASNGNADEEPASLRTTVPPVLQRFAAPFPVFVDGGATHRRRLIAAARLDGFGYPCSVLIDRRGALAQVWIGKVGLAEIEKSVAAVLQEE